MSVHNLSLSKTKFAIFTAVKIILLHRCANVMHLLIFDNISMHNETHLAVNSLLITTQNVTCYFIKHCLVSCKLVTFW